MGKKFELFGVEAERVKLLSVKDNVRVRKYNHLQGLVNEIANMVSERDGKISGGVYSKKWLEASWLFCNIVDYAVAYKSKYVLKGLNPRSWNSGGTEATLSEFKHVLDVLSEGGWVKVYRGGITSVDIYGFKFMRSVIEIDKGLISRVEGLRFHASNKTQRRVDLEKAFAREEDTKKEIKLIKTMKVEMYNNISKKYNEFLSGFDLKYDGELVPIQQYRPIFIEDDTKGGRWYNVSGGVQTLPRSLRGGLTIDGEKLSEVDYKEMHPRMLMQELYNDGNKDVAKLVKSGVRFNPYAMHSLEGTNLKEEDARVAAKLALLICLNAKDRRSAVFAVRKKYREEGLCRTISVPNVVSRVVESNLIIKDFLFSGEGVYLQNRDSYIMATILNTCVNRGIPVLPYHDGVLVKDSDKGEVKKIFEDSWEKSYRSKVFCEVEVS